MSQCRIRRLPIKKGFKLEWFLRIYLEIMLKIKKQLLLCLGLSPMQNVEGQSRLT